MNHVIEDLKSISGVLGGFIFNPQKGIFANNLPPIYKVPKLTEIGRMVVKIYNTGGINFSSITDVSLYYEETIIIIKEVTHNLFLIVFGDPDSNINLLTISMNLIVQELKKAADGDIIESQPILEEVSGKAYTVEEVLESGPMSKPLKGMQTALAKIMGPMASIIFGDAIKEWLQKNQPSFSTLQNLIDILAREIGDPGKMRSYNQMIKPYIDMGKE